MIKYSKNPRTGEKDYSRPYITCYKPISTTGGLEPLNLEQLCDMNVTANIIFDEQITRYMSDRYGRKYSDNRIISMNVTRSIRHQTLADEIEKIAI